MLAANDARAPLVVPTLSWLTSIDRKLHQGRLLLREAEAVKAIHAEIRRATKAHIHAHIGLVERLSLNLLERYHESESLRSNWEVRCALGNLLTVAVSERTGNASTLVKDLMQSSASRDNWDMAQMLFDGLHHGDELSEWSREFLLSTALDHDHRQVRWNVAAALKSIRISDRDLRQIMSRLLRDPSPWVVKELIDVGLKSERILAELSRPKHVAIIHERLDSNHQLLEHAVLTVGAQGRNRLPLELPSLLEMDSAGGWDRRSLVSSLGHRPLTDRRKAILLEDFHRVETLKASLQGHHGRLYRAAEHVVFSRLARCGPEAQQEAITTYLASTHDALAWASVRALFSGRLDELSDEFLAEAVSQMLTHPSEWIRRECVEETLRLNDGRRKYIALRQIEFHRHDLARLDEVRPYLVQIGMLLAGVED